MLKKYILGGVFLFTISLFFVSCEYEFIELKTVNPQDSISFSKQIEPVFTDQGCTACHNTGNQLPDLTTGNAYASIIATGVVNTSNPETSKLYSFPDPATGDHIWKKYTETQAQLVLLWIQQGALNN